MNILIPDTWLREFVETEATPESIAGKLSLRAFSVEKIHRNDDGEAVYEIEVTPNRSDALSLIGIAREVAAVLLRFGVKTKLNLPDALNTIDAPDADLLDITIKNPALCPRFAAIVLDNVKIVPSPELVQKRLKLCGVRALNNVVDVSNYVMLQTGQPMHIFDFDKLGTSKNGEERKEMILRESEKGEKVLTLDGVERVLPKGAIVIESGDSLVDLCGIMGGQNSAVDENTKKIVAFVQIYDPVKIRKTAMFLGLRTEASARFEKGIDPQGVIPALNSSLTLLRRNAGAKLASKLYDIQNETWQPREVDLEIPAVEKVLGVEISAEEIMEIMRSVGFISKIKDTPLMIPAVSALVPSYRDTDIRIGEDLIEEIARLWGYENIPSTLPIGELPGSSRDKQFSLEDRAKDFLKYQGFYECCNYSFVSAEDLKKSGFDPDRAVAVKNPLNEELTHLRPSLLPSLLKNIEQNQNIKDEIRFFELERTYHPTEDGKLPRENFRLTAILHGKVRTEPQNIFYELKGIFGALFSELGIKNIILEKETSLSFICRSSGLNLGTIKLVDEHTAAFDLDFDAIAKIAVNLKTFTPIPLYPPVIEDLSFFVDREAYVGEIIKAAEMSSSDGIGVSAKVVDIYEDDNLKSRRKKSVTIRINFQAADRSLSSDESAEERKKIEKVLREKFSVEVRRF